MSNYNVPWAHDTSLDDADLLRRCERRIMLFPRHRHDFSLASVDSTLSAVVPTSSSSVLDGSGEGNVEETLLSSTLTTTAKRDSTGAGNIYVDRNPCQDSRRWVRQGYCGHVTPNNNLKVGPTGTDRINLTNSRASNRLSELDQQNEHRCQGGSCERRSTAKQARMGKHKDLTNNVTNLSSDSSPIIDNLILESQIDSKYASENKAKQRRNAAKCIQNERQIARAYASRDTGTHNYENRKQKEQKSTSSRPPSSCKSSKGSKEVLDPSSEHYLKRLDNILQRMSSKNDKPSSRSSERIARPANTKEVVSNYVNKNQRISPNKRSCNCPIKAAQNNKININGLIEEVKRNGQVRSRLGAKQDMPKQDNICVTRNRSRSRCQQRPDKRKPLDGSEASVSKDSTRQHIISHCGTERSTFPHSQNRRRSNSLSALPRCQAHTSTSSSLAHIRGLAKSHSCGTPASSRTYSWRDSPASLTKQQINILRHIPGDITPDEVGTLLNTLLSIAERRHCLKSGGGGEESWRDDQRNDTELALERLSKYEKGNISDSNTSTYLSPKSCICYSDKATDDVNNTSLVKTISTSDSSDFKDDINPDSSTSGNGSLRYGTIGSIDSETLTEYATSKVKANTVDNAQEPSAQFTSIGYTESDIHVRDFSCPNYRISKKVLDPRRTIKTEQLSKKSAIVLPFDDKFTVQNRPLNERERSGVMQSCSDQLVTSNYENGACNRALCQVTTTSEDREDQQAASHECPERQQSQLISAPNTGSCASSRHIGWKFPLHTERISQVMTSDFCEREKDASLSTEGRTAVVKSVSVLSDGLLYSKSTHIPLRLQRTSHDEKTKRYCPSSSILSGAKREEYDGGCQPRDGKARSNPSLNNSLPITPCGSSRLPCPHFGVQRSNTFICQSGRYSDPKYNEYDDVELDNAISELRSKMRSTYKSTAATKFTDVNNELTLLKDDISSHKCDLLHTKNTQEVHDQHSNIEIHAEGQGQVEVTDLDALSCSADTELTNTSISNRLLELDGAFPGSPSREWRPKSHIRNQLLSSTSANGNELHRSLPYPSYDKDLLHISNDLTPGTETSTQLSDLPTRYPIHREWISAYPNEHPLPKYKATGEILVDTTKSLLALPAKQLSNLMSAEISSHNVCYRTINEVCGSGRDSANYQTLNHSCGPKEGRYHTEHICWQTGSTLSMRKTEPAGNVQPFRNSDGICRVTPPNYLKFLSSNAMLGNTEPYAILEPSRDVKSYSKKELQSNFEPPSNVEQYGNFEPPSNVEQYGNFELPSNGKQYGNFKPPSNVEQKGNFEPPSNGKQYDNFEPPSNGKQYDNFEPPSNVEQYGNFEPPSNVKQYNNFEPPSNGKQYGNFEPPSNVEQYGNFEPPSNVKQYSNFEPPRNVEQYGNFEPPSNVEQYGNFEPPSNVEQYGNFEPPSNVKQYNNFEPPSNGKQYGNFEPPSNVEQYGNFEPPSNVKQYSNFEPPSNVEQYGNFEPPSNVKQYNNFEPPSNGKQYGNFEPPSNVEQYGNFEPPSNVKQYSNFEPPRNVEQYGNFEPPSNVEQYGNFEPPSNGKQYGNFKPPSNGEQNGNFEPPSNGKQYDNFEPSSNVEQYGNFEPPSNGEQYDNFEPPSNVEEYDNFEPPSNVEQYGNFEPPSNVKQYSNKEPPSNMKSYSFLEPPSNIKPYSSKEPSSSVKPCSIPEPFSNVKPCSIPEPVSNVKPCSIPEPFSNVKTCSIPEPFSNVKPRSNKKPLKNRKPFIMLEPPSNTLKLRCNSDPPKNMQQLIPLQLTNDLTLPSNLQPTIDLQHSRKFESTLLNKSSDKNNAEIDLVSSPKMKRQDPKGSCEMTNLSQLKQNAESILAEVYRKYYVDMLTSNMNSGEMSHISNALELLQNFSPIHQVDVNTRYPITPESRIQVPATETTNKKHNQTAKTPKQVLSVRSTPSKASNKHQIISTKSRNMSRDCNKVDLNSPNSYPQYTDKVSNILSRVTDKDILQIQKSNFSTTGRSGKYSPITKHQKRSKCTRSVKRTTPFQTFDSTNSSETGCHPIVIDVTCSVDVPNDQRERTSEKEETRIPTEAFIVKTYSSTSAVPVNIKVISDLSDQSTMNSETLIRPYPETSSPRCDRRKKHWTPFLVCGSHDQNSRKNSSECFHNPLSADRCQPCIVSRFNGATCRARKKLASSIKNASRFDVNDVSLMSVSCEEKSNESETSSHNHQGGGDHSGWNNINYNNSNTFQDGHNCSCQPDMSPTVSSRDNEPTFETSRPSAKILGELAFQLDRRILDYVFGMEGSKRRRFYGYTVNNICHMMNKECKNMCGNDDAVRKSELAFRLKKLLIGLKKFGYDIKVHGDFAQLMVNTYGLLPCPPDVCIIDDFGLHDASCIATLITQLACNEFEATNLYILLESLKYLSKCDGRPLFVW